MSTRASIFYARGFHLYDELLDGRVYLEWTFGRGAEVLIPICKSKHVGETVRNILRTRLERIAHKRAMEIVNAHKEPKP
jgi:hypothetical protein